MAVELERYPIRFKRWLVFHMYRGPEMENIGQKKKPCEEKENFHAINGCGKCILKTI